MEDLEELEASEGGRLMGPWFGEDGWGGEGKGAISHCLSSSLKMLSGGRDFFHKRQHPFCVGGLGCNKVRVDARFRRAKGDMQVRNMC